MPNLKISLKEFRQLVKEILQEQINVNEALKDDIPSYMQGFIQKTYKKPEKYLSMDIPKHTDIIPNVKIEVNDSSITNKTTNQLIKYFSNKLISQFKDTELYKILSSDINLNKLVIDSIGYSPIRNYEENYEMIKNISLFYSKEFKLLESKNNNDIINPKFSNNKSGIATFLKSVKTAFKEEFKNLNVETIINDKRLVGLRDPILNHETNINKIKDSKLYLYVTDKPDDKLRMSISLFYDSCQNIYTGKHNKQLLSNVFDPNSKVAYLIFDSTFKDNFGNTQPFTSIARVILRVNDKGNIMFDKVYPSNMQDIFYRILEENLNLKNTGKKDDVYSYKVIGLPPPYMDTYKIKTYGDKNFEKNKRLTALLYITDFDVEDVEIIDEKTFKIYGEEWLVYNHDEALELAKENVAFPFYITYYNQKIENLISKKFISLKNIKKILGIENIIFDHMTHFKDYLKKEFKIITLEHLHEYLKEKKYNPFKFYKENLNIENMIKDYENEDEFIAYVLSNDGQIYTQYEGYMVIKLNKD